MKISIITATLNNEKTIFDCLSSVANQTYDNIEHIIIDGKSTDKTIEIAENFDHISKIVSEKDLGIYYALNKGISESKGDIIGFLHADDYLAEKTILSEIAKLFKHDNFLDAIYGDLVYISPNKGSKNIRYWKSGSFNIKMLKKGWMPPHPTFYAKKELYKKFGVFNINYKISADYDLMLRFLNQNIKLKYLPKILVKMRLGGKSNKNIKNIFKKTTEDFYCIKRNKIGGILTLLNKNFSKISQFLNKKAS